MYSRFFAFYLIIVDGANLQACGTDLTCLCTSSIASGLENCAQCQYEADPTSQQTLQTALDQYASGCEASNNSVGSLTLSATGATSSTSSVRSASLTSASAITSTSAPPAFATSTPSVASTSRAVATSSTASQASATGGLTGSGNGASGIAVQMTGAFVVAGVAAALAVF
ncbi:hypothetical protein FS837_007518 [Tulasnella sp. UAMH 9824]|nr:hypothetical protein FS837_007518 [Tulasnella sp. UAMH 9824]